MLGAQCFTGLKLLAKALAQDANDGGNTSFIADARFDVTQSHLICSAHSCLRQLSQMVAASA
jgi:hypothetical protein